MSSSGIKKCAILLASARANGDTRNVVDQLRHHLPCDLIDLLDYNIQHFDYNHENTDDDFLELIRRIVENYDLLLFATPVYWYAMSGRMKVFFDRLTDLLTIDKTTGRRLRGKSMAAMSCSNGDHLGDRFWLPFRHSADYLGMHWLGGLHTYRTQVDEEALVAFARELAK